MQNRITSLVEQCMNTLSGFVVSLLIWIFIIIPHLGIEPDMNTNIKVTLIFTAASIVRGYVWRRFFNYLAVRFDFGK